MSPVHHKIETLTRHPAALALTAADCRPVKPAARER